MKTTKKVIKEFGKNDKDSGSSEVQIALLSKRIQHLSMHLNNNKKDFHSRYGLIKMVGKRRKLLRYLMKKDDERYQTILKKLNLRK